MAQRQLGGCLVAWAARTEWQGCVEEAWAGPPVSPKAGCLAVVVPGALPEDQGGAPEPC